MTEETDAEVASTAALARREPQLAKGSAWALARMTDDEFAELVRMQQVGRQRLQQVMLSMMREGVHYGKIPGVDKPVLFKAGAEVLCQMFRLVAEPQTKIEWGDGTTSPRATVLARCLIHADNIDGPVVGVGEAGATLWERKYRYRYAELVCPDCGKSGTIKRSRFPDKSTGDKGWYCYSKAGGCGAEFLSTAPAITEQDRGLVENPDAMDQLNTIIKMANKRARVDGVITATSSSDLLTQDLEEQCGEPPAPEPSNGAAKPPEKKPEKGAGAAAAPSIRARSIAAIKARGVDPQDPGAMAVWLGNALGRRVFPGEALSPRDWLQVDVYLHNHPETDEAAT